MSNPTLSAHQQPATYECRTLVDLLRWRSLHQPDQPAYAFLHDGEIEEVRLSYAQLDRQVRAIATFLQQIDAVGSRAILLYPPSLAYVMAFLGCLYAGVVAVPAYPPRSASLMSRLESVAVDAGASLILTTSRLLADAAHAAPQLRGLGWHATDTIPGDLADAWSDPSIDENSLAFLQYTSGSTKMPKGVMVSHGNLMHNERTIKLAFGHTEQSTFVGWLPLYHDMGLIGNVLQPLYIGALSVLMSPLAFLQRPLRWLQAISRYRAHTSGAPNFAYDLCVQRVTPAEREMLDLSCWQVAYNGAEPIRYETLERFATTFAPCGFRYAAFYPCYGLAEATLFVTGGQQPSPPVTLSVQAAALAQDQVVIAPPNSEAPTLVSSGNAWLDQRVLIVHPTLRTINPPDQVGEIWLAGGNVAQGYWNQPSETQYTFQAYLADTGEGPFLRTGDLGFLRDGELFVTGRLKDLIIIRGHNHYPQDIEWTVEQAHSALRSGCGAAFTIDVAGEERLVVMNELHRQYYDIDATLVVQAVRQAVAEYHGLDVYAVVLLRSGSILKTTSGKIRRQACRAEFIAGRLPVIGLSIQSAQQVGAFELKVTAETLHAVAPDERLAILEVALCELIAARKGLIPSWIQPEQSLHTIGFDSLQTIEIQHQIEAAFGVVLPAGSLLRGVSVRQLAEQIITELATSPATVDAAIQPASAELTEHPLSYGQQALWFFYQSAPESAVYNIARAARISGELDVAAFQRALRRLVERHPTLRTVFPMHEGIPAQRVLPVVHFTVQQHDATGWSAEELDQHMLAAAQLPFDLEHDLPLRITLYACGSGAYVMLLVIHHIVADFWSLVVLLHELSLFYAAEKDGQPAPLPALRLNYNDYVYWQRGRLAGAEGERLWAYWQTQLAGELPILQLPTDRPRPPVQSFRGSVRRFTLAASLTEKIQTLSRNSGTTLFMTLLAAYQVLLYRYSGQSDFVVGTLAAGRSRADVSGLLGYFVNPLPIRARIQADMPFTALLEAVRQLSLDALAHQDLPFGLLVERLRPPRDARYPVLIQSLFVFQREYLLDAEGLRAMALGIEGTPAQIGALTLEPIALPQHTAQFDLTLTMAEIGGKLAGFWEYNTDLFDEASIARMQAHFEQLLNACATQPEQPVAALPLLAAAEQQQIVKEWNNTARPYVLDQCLHELVEAQVQRTPDAIALVFTTEKSNEQLSYRALDAQANRLARYLRNLGVGADTPVGICLERSCAMVIGLLGILKAGGAYVPIDPDYPADRLAFILADAQIQVLITRQELLAQLPPLTARAICIDTDLDAMSAESAAPLPPIATADTAAYVIYTSGSTGKPKGAVIPHRGICNRLLWMQEAYMLTGADRVLQKTSFSFDVSVWEFFWPLLSGACLVLARPGGQQDNAYLVATINQHHITTMHFVPSMLQLFLEEPGLERANCLRQVMCSGEALPFELQQRFLARLDAQLHNLYGPTEASVDVTAWACDQLSPYRTVPLGYPIANTQLYILDALMQPVPIGVAGELYIGGVGLARGYLNRPELTAARFVPDPLSAQPGARLYRTGDRARYFPDGSIAFLGRTDYQVKIRGNRIELGEIEAVLGQHPAIRDAVVMACSDQDQHHYLVAYYTLRAGSAAPALEELHTFLKTQLPEAMIPAVFLHLATIPLTPSGKVDRKALPLPDHTRPTLRQVFVAPRTPTEIQLAAIWGKVLGVQQIGIDDNFFLLGGDSIRSLRVVAQLRAQGYSIEIAHIFSHQTIRVLGAALDSGQVAAAVLAPTQPFALIAPADRQKLPVEVEDAYPISMAQQAVIFHSAHSTHYEIYVTSLCAQAPFDLNAMQQVLTRLMTRHAFLRTAFDLTTYSRPLQLVFTTMDAPFELADIAHLTAAEQETTLADWLQAERKRKFDLTHGPLIRFAVHRRSQNTFQFTVSSFALDGWCVASVITEVFQGYFAHLAGQLLPLVVPTLSYRDFVALEQAALHSESQRDYWAAKLADRPAAALPHWPATPQTTNVALQQRVTLSLDPTLVAGLQQLAQAIALPLKSILLAAHLRVMRLLNAQADVLTGLEVNGRPEAHDGDQIIGVFNNIVPLRLSLAGGTWIDLVRAAFAAEQDLLSFRRYPLVQLQRDHGGQPLFETLFVFTHFHIYQQLQALAGFDILSAYAPDQTYVPLTAHFNLDAWSAELRLLLDYNPQKLCEQQVQAIAGYYVQALTALAQRPHERYETAVLLSPQELQQRISLWNDTAAAYPAQLCLHQLFEAQVARTPDAIALVAADQPLTYRELDACANRVAHRLQQCGVTPDTPVGIWMARSPALIIAMLGILKAGAAYLPLDPQYPSERLAWMISNAQPALVLYDGDTNQAVSELFGASYAGRLLAVAPLAHDSSLPSHAPATSAQPDNVAYIIYTSGSTGQPKGIAVPHRGVVNYLHWCTQAYPLDTQRSTPLYSSIAFDLTITALFVPLISGGSVRLIAEDQGVEALGVALQAAPAGLVKITPAHLDVVNQQLAAQPTHEYAQTLVIGGEQLLARHIAFWQANSPQTALFNEYGPTETVVGCCIYAIPPDWQSSGPVPIGRPIANMQIYLFDDGQPVPIGVPGEVYIGGVGLARGYWQRPDLTAERFVPNPLSAVAGERLYKTGDMARYLPDGTLEYLGRADRQIKLRGYRIELDEIERVIEQYPLVQQAAVLLKEGAASRQLIAYVVPRSGATLESAALKDFLRQRLPDYMLPAAFVRLAALPLTVHGKVDYKQLPEHHPQEERSTRIEQLLRQIERLSVEEAKALLHQARQSAKETSDGPF